MTEGRSGSRKRLYLRLLARFAVFSGVILIFIFAAPLVFSLAAPFLFAFIAAAALNPLLSKFSKLFRIPYRLAAFTTIVLVFLVAASLIVWFAQTLSRESVTLTRNIQSMWEYARESVTLLTERFVWLVDYIPFDTDSVLTGLTDSFMAWLQSTSLALADYILSNTMSITTRVGGLVLSTVVFIMSAYFISADYASIGAVLGKLRGTRFYNNASTVINAAKSAFGGYLKAQILLAALAFAVMFVALNIYRQEYALLIALALAVIDFLPFLGTAVVLVPWAVISYLGGDTGKCVFLLVLTGSFFIFRRFVEPKIVSSQMRGLPPLLALFGTYAGMKLAGVPGVIFGPIIVMIFISIIKTDIFDNIKKDLKDVYHDISGFLRRD